ncbi:PREDICTED: kelch-like protein 24 [Branchiostoma belcheri]|uniref:Kelch-like protein 24 n=1 Tax=Branchiostoma belcheri TaxID=7741 RepID=A0A6P5AIW4_BRABE|nr:PREDICTED: kelch-like protein 24 [Branchiostoma belcheri]
MYADPFDDYGYDEYDDSSDRYGDNRSYDSDYACGVRRPEYTKSYDEDDSCCFEHTIHCRELLAELNNQRQTRDFFDVVVKVQGRRFRCHRAVLASTPFFKAMLSSHLAERKSKVIEVREIDSTSFSKILDFLYTGKICIGKDDVQDILQAAHMLQIEKITQYCQEFVKDNLCLSNCIGVMRLADMYGFSDLTEKARDQALSHFSKIGKNEEFLSLSVEELLDLLTDEDLHVTNEEDVVDSVIRWLDHDPESRRTAIVTIFQEIRLLSVRVSALLKLESHPVVQNSPECLAKITAAKAKHLAKAEAEADEAEVNPRLGTSDDLAILVGGWKADEVMRGDEELLPLQSVICLDRASEQCYNVTDLPTAAFGYMSVARAERHLYVTGGRDHPLVGEQGPHSAPSRQAFRYDFQTDTWTRLPDMPRGRAGHQSAVVDGKVFLVGGDTDDTPAFSMDCYDLQEEAWINPPTLPEINPSSDLTVTACGSNLVAVELFDNPEEGHRYDEQRKLRVHRFDVKTAHWLFSEVPKSTIGWYCRDLELLSDNKEDETASTSSG